LIQKIPFDYLLQSSAANFTGPFEILNFLHMQGILFLSRISNAQLKNRQNQI
jgi:hypothetical protein